MDNPFFDHPILNSPYEYPKRHWELDDQGQPTQQIIEHRRRASSSHRFLNPKSEKVWRVSNKLSSMKAKDSPLRNSNTISTPSSIGFAKKLTSGEVYRRRRRSLLKPRGYCSIGAITSLTIFAHSFVRSRPLRRSSGLPRSRRISSQEKHTGSPCRSEQRRQPRAPASRAEARHRRRQDYGHGHAHRLANDQRCPPRRK